MQEKPQKEHRWLERLIGEWTGELECAMGPDHPPITSSGTLVVRSLGALWIVAEGQIVSQGQGETHDAEAGKTIMMLGFDAKSQRYVGTFAASVMTHLWVYSGTLDKAEKRLTLDTEGPNFTQTGMAKYQDIIEIIDDDHHTLSSQMLSDDGGWHHFMTAHYLRKK